MLVILLFISAILSTLCCAKITNKQYASMPELFFRDDFEKCMLLEDEALYCTFTYELEPLNIEKVPDVWKIIQEVSSDEFNYRHDHLRHGICVPFTCPNVEISNRNDTKLIQGLTECYNRKYEGMGLRGTITTLRCDTNKRRYPVDWLDISAAVGFACHAALIVFASIYEGMARYKSEEEYERITGTRWGKAIRAFSIPRNWHRLKTVKNTPDVEKFRPFQGVRFYNNLIVIFSHTNLFLSVNYVSNPKYIESMTQTISSLFLSSGSLAVSTNFFLSSFFTVYGLFSYFEDKKKMKLKFLLVAFIKRYLRLTPTLAVVILFSATWIRHFSGAHFWYHIVEQDFLRCRQNWWTNLLYVNNMVEASNMCMPITWYLALDTQYFGIILLVIWLMYKYPKYIWHIIGSLLCLNLAGTFIKNYIYNFRSHLMPHPEMLFEGKIILDNPQFHHQLSCIIGNTAGSIIGLGFGYQFYKYRNKELYTSKLLLHQILYILWGFGLSLGIIILPGIHFIWNKAEHDPFWASMYNALSRPIFILGIGYLLFAASKGLGWVVKSCLEWHPAYILGRLSYSAYLIHYTVLMYRSSMIRAPIFLSDLVTTFHLAADIFLTYIAALILSVIVEMPLTELQHLIIPIKATADDKSKEE